MASKTNDGNLALEPEPELVALGDNSASDFDPNELSNIEETDFDPNEISDIEEVDLSNVSMKKMNHQKIVS